MAGWLSNIRGSLVFLGYVVNTLFWCVPLFTVSLLKLLPIPALQKLCSGVLDAIASCWISCNAWMAQHWHYSDLQCTGQTEFEPNAWYMVVSNHQSWVDILVLQRVFNHKIPFLKFFLKKELIFVPFLGLAWWALDFPFMRRYSTAQLKKNPALKGKDIEITRQACAKFKYQPVSVMNFVEGTRFTAEKHQAQGQAFQYLLRPKAGGIAFALAAMPEIDTLVDVSIYYPQGIPSFWDLICGRVPEIKVHTTTRTIDESWRGDYQNDRQFKQQFQQQLNHLWLEKDQQLALMRDTAERSNQSEQPQMKDCA